MFLTEIYPECFVEYVADKGHIYCVGESVARGYEAGLLRSIEKRVDILRAKKAGCQGAVQICRYLNTGRRFE